MESNFYHIQDFRHFLYLPQDGYVVDGMVDCYYQLRSRQKNDKVNIRRRGAELFYRPMMEEETLSTKVSSRILSYELSIK